MQINELVFSSARLLIALFLCVGSALAVTTSGPPAGYVSRPGGAFDGVASLLLSSVNGIDQCSGALLPTGRHILTAAHCLTDSAGHIDITRSTIFFDLPAGTTTLEGATYSVHPFWSGDVSNGFDLGIISLRSTAPAGTPRYDIYRGSNEVGSIATVAGYGISGTGYTGEQENQYPFGTRRTGTNRYDDYFSALGITPPGSLLGFDFDDGTQVHDAFGFYGIENRGTGSDEVMIARGDSGGPSFLGGKIVGVHSFGAWAGSPPDIDGVYLNASFGEFGADTRVSTLSRYIDSVLVPEPSTALLSISALFVILTLYKFKARRRV